MDIAKSCIYFKNQHNKLTSSRESLYNGSGLFKACLELRDERNTKLCPPAYTFNGLWWFCKGECLKHMYHVFINFVVHHGGFRALDLWCQIANLVSQRLTAARLDQHGRHVAKVVCKDRWYVGMSDQLLVFQIKMSRVHGCEFCRVWRQIVIQRSILPRGVRKGQVHPRLLQLIECLCVIVQINETYWYQHCSLGLW